MLKAINYNGVEIEVSNEGEIFTMPYDKAYCDGRVYFYPRIKLALCRDKGGYLITRHRGVNIKAHRAVAQAFLPNPGNLPQVNHKDEDKTNNFVWVNEDGSVDPQKSNLEWCTCEYNRTYGTANQRISASNKNCPVTSKKVKQIDKDGCVIGEYPSMQEAARQTGIDRSQITRACNGGRGAKTAGGYRWEYIY